MNAQAVQPAKNEQHVLVKAALWLVEFLLNIVIGSIRLAVFLGCLYMVFAAVEIYIHPDSNSLSAVLGIAFAACLLYLILNAIVSESIPDDLVPPALQQNALSLKELELLCLLTRPRTGDFCRLTLNAQSSRARLELNRSLIGLLHRRLIKKAGREARKRLFELTPKGQDLMTAQLKELDRVRLTETFK